MTLAASLWLFRARIAAPKMLLLDEPAEGIQPDIIKQIGAVIASLRDEGRVAIVLVEQYFDFAYGLANVFVALNRGSVVLNAPRAQVACEAVLERVKI